MLASWNCVSDACIDPGNGSGTFNSIESCEASCTSSVEEYEIEKGKPWTRIKKRLLEKYLR